MRVLLILAHLFHSPYPAAPLPEPYWPTKADELAIKALVAPSLSTGDELEWKFGPAFDQQTYCGSVASKPQPDEQAEVAVFAVRYHKGPTGMMPYGHVEVGSMLANEICRNVLAGFRAAHPSVD